MCASASHDGTLRLWNTETGAEAQVLQPGNGSISDAIFHTEEISAVAFHPSGTMMASGSYDKCAPPPFQFLRFQPSRPTPTEPLTCSMLLLAVPLGISSPTPDRLSPHQILSTFALLGSQTSQRVHPSLHSAAPSPLAPLLPLVHSAHRRRVIIYKCSDPAKFLLNPEAAPWEGKFNLEGHTARVWCVSFSPDGKYVVSGAWDGTVCIYPCHLFEGEEAEQETPFDSFDEGVPSMTLQCFANVWTAVFQPEVKNQNYNVLATGAADHKVPPLSVKPANVHACVACVIQGFT